MDGDQMSLRNSEDSRRQCQQSWQSSGGVAGVDPKSGWEPTPSWTAIYPCRRSWCSFSSGHENMSSKRQSAMVQSHLQQLRFSGELGVELCLRSGSNTGVRVMLRGNQVGVNTRMPLEIGFRKGWKLMKVVSKPGNVTGGDIMDIWGGWKGHETMLH